MVGLFLSLVFTYADIKEVRCSPFSAANKPTFTARGPLDLDAKKAVLNISLRGEPSFDEEYELVAIHNRWYYKMYFLENAASEAPSIVLRISNSQLDPTSDLFLQSTESFSAACSFAQ